VLNETFFHLCAFSGSIAQLTADLQIPAVSDQIFTRNSANNFILPQPGKLRLATGLSANLQRWRINTPSLRQIGLPYLAPVNVSATIPSPVNVYNPGEFGPTIPQADEIQSDATQGGAAAEVVNIFHWYQFRRQEVPVGVEYKLRLTATITGITNGWANGTMSPGNTLPAGIYAVTGLDVVGTNILAGRLIFAGGGWRPGCLARQSLGQIPRPEFDNGELGSYGTFDSVNLPNLEIFCVGANASQEIYMSVVRVGNR
jgi:hypothetical protein